MTTKVGNDLWVNCSLKDAVGERGIVTDGDWIIAENMDPNGDVRLLQLADIGVGEFLDRSRKFITAEKFEELKCTELLSDDVLVARMPDPIGRACLFRHNGQRSITAVDVSIIRTDNTLSIPKYLMYVLNSRITSDQIRRKITGTTRSRISRKNLETIEIPLPPLSEQRRIVEILDQADALRKKRAEADKVAERILPALFYKMFGDPAKNDKRLTRERLGSLMKVRSGESVPVKKLHPTGGFPVYGGNGINGYHTDYMLDGPVVVIGRVGQYCGSVYYSRQRCWVTDNALFVCECDRRLHPRYLAEALKTAKLNQYASRAGQPLVSGSRIYPVQILVPPMPLQLQFVKQIEDLDVLLAQAKRSGQSLDSLNSAMLYRAFSGELTAKWREAHMKELLQEMEEQARELGDHNADE